MTVSVYVIGTEITRGVIQDSHVPFLCSSLSQMGFTVKRAVIVPDDGSIEGELEVCALDSDVILVTGGLGPTADDLTRRIIAREAGVPLVMNQEAWDVLYRRVGERIHGANERQAYIPRGFELIPNPKGTAPGFRGSFVRNGRTVAIAAMPGPPVELQYMYVKHVRPFLASMIGHVDAGRDEYTVFLIAEARLDDLCRQCAVEGVSWGTRFQQFRISLYVQGGTAGQRKTFIRKLQSLAGEGLIVDGDDADACKLLTDCLVEKGLCVSTAESCTAGLVAKLLTDTSGSSGWFWGGAVTYANQAKQVLTGVKSETLEKYGAVSPETALEMAGGILETSGSDVSLSITGVAGPGRGSTENPAGTAWVGFCSRFREPEAVKLSFPFISRDSSRRRFAVAALILCRLYIQGGSVVDTVSRWLYI